ncbi:hypothetical protein [Borrelia sp. RT1S]|uniref:hypothetical protein n=1 Tax=Borrelia sp. RT1S TaxID=2898580 RepID=UPI001E40E6B2|nr:hypothetical protein [Borrelia sp. RT1S]UGQ17978.1 hypothetical protein LSO05_05960 [Borrelia sp. RT1S]
MALNYLITTHKELDDSIKALRLGSGNKKAEIDIVTGVLLLLAAFDDETRTFLGSKLKDDNLEKVKGNKSEIERVAALLNEFITKRDLAMQDIKTYVKEAESKIGNEAQVMDEFSNISLKTDSKLQDMTKIILNTKIQ